MSIAVRKSGTACLLDDLGKSDMVCQEWTDLLAVRRAGEGAYPHTGDSYSYVFLRPADPSIERRKVSCSTYRRASVVSVSPKVHFASNVF